MVKVCKQCPGELGDVRNAAPGRHRNNTQIVSDAEVGPKCMRYLSLTYRALI